MLNTAVEDIPMEDVKANVLFVDDEPRVLTSMRAMFRRKYGVFLAESGAAALQILADEDIDVVVSDQRMPEMTGVEVLAEIKALSPNTMRILLTGYADLDALEASINDSEVFRYLMKPCPPAQLKETVALAVQAVKANELDDVPLPVPEVNVVPFSKEALDRELGGGKAAQPAQTEADQDTGAPAEVPPPDQSILSEDEVETLVAQATTAEPAPVIAADDVEILVLSTDQDLMAGIEEAVGQDHVVRFASQQNAAVDMLSQHPVGVLVTDASRNEEEVQMLTAELKLQVPELVTILVSDRSDANMLISLINHGQVFRFLLKPVQPGQARIWLNSAVAKYIELMSHEGARARHRVQPSVENPQLDAGFVAGLLSGIARIKDRLSQWKRLV